MTRSNYSEDYDDDGGLWRGAVASAIRGARGQAFLKEMRLAMEALPEHKLVAHELVENGSVCAIGAVGKARGIDMTMVDPEESEAVARLFGISDALTREIAYMNDEGALRPETPEERYSRMLAWIDEELH